MEEDNVWNVGMTQSMRAAAQLNLTKALALKRLEQEECLQQTAGSSVDLSKEMQSRLELMRSHSESD